MAAILVAVESTGNRRALLEWLAPLHEICGLGEARTPERPLDLIIVDRPALHRFGDVIAERVRTEKISLPVLLIVPASQKGRKFAAHHSLESGLAQGILPVDEMITAPITKSELELRIINLLGLRQREKQLLETRDLVRMAAELAQLGFWEWDTETNQVHFPPEWSKHLGYEESLPERLEEWLIRLHPDDRMKVLGEVSRIRTAPQDDFEIEYRLQHRTGSYHWFRSRVALIPGQAGGGSRLVFSQLDISAHKAAQEYIRLVSQHDSLTGLPNRALLYEFGEHLLAGARRSGGKLAFLFIDMDRFKPINDTYGHHVGDELLQQVARRITASVRGEDFVSRLGGDEFLVVLTQIRNSDDAARAAQNAIQQLCEPYRVAGFELHCCASIGVSLFPQDGETLDLLIQQADQAMYSAKDAGRNIFRFFTEDLNARRRAAAMMEQRLRDGIMHEEFQLLYQPVIDAVNADIVGAEALIRWPQTDQDALTPAEFLPVAESTGLIRALGAWVIHEACRQHLRWLEAGLPPIGVAINVSDLQFRSQGFAQELGFIANKVGVARHYLSLELTESALVSNIDEAKRVLDEIKRMGIKVALDAFGTGVASLSQLGRLPLDRIKVDRSFIHSLEVDVASRAILDTAVTLGKTLELEIVAEGVENETMLQFVKHRNCHRMQGYHFCKPLPGDEFARWYRTRSQRLH